MRCYELSGRAFSGTNSDGWNLSVDRSVAYVTMPTPEELAVGALEVMRRLREDGVYDGDVDWSFSPWGDLWRHVESRRQTVVPQRRESRDDNLGAGLLGFAIGVSL